MIVYKRLFHHRDVFSGSSAIVYSTLVSYSLFEYGQVFDCDGNFDIDLVQMYLDDCRDEYGRSYIEVPYYTCSTITESMEMSERNVRYVLKDLRSRDFLVGDYIYCPLNLIKGGYVKIVKGTDLKGWQLVFYSILKERASYFGGSIDTWAYKLADMFSTTTNNVYVLINTLKKKGYVYRSSNGRLVIR